MSQLQVVLSKVYSLFKKNSSTSGAVQEVGDIFTEKADFFVPRNKRGIKEWQPADENAQHHFEEARSIESLFLNEIYGPQGYRIIK